MEVETIDFCFTGDDYAIIQDAIVDSCNNTKSFENNKDAINDS